MAARSKDKRGAPFGNKNAVGNRGGRGATPTYRVDFHPEVARKIARLGATNAHLADIFGVNDSTIERWTREHDDFRKALRLGRMEADAEVAEALYKRAVGYSHPAEKIFSHPETKFAPARVVRVRTRKHYPPDTAAAVRLLAVHQPDPWASSYSRRTHGVRFSGPPTESKQRLMTSLLDLIQPKSDPVG